MSGRRDTTTGVHGRHPVAGVLQYLELPSALLVSLSRKGISLHSRDNSRGRTAAGFKATLLNPEAVRREKTHIQPRVLFEAVTLVVSVR